MSTLTTIFSVQAEKMDNIVYIENAATAFPTRQRIRMIVK